MFLIQSILIYHVESDRVSIELISKHFHIQQYDRTRNKFSDSDQKRIKKIS